MKFKWTPAIDLIAGARYAAIVDCLAADIASGRLRSGDRLPTHRALAERLDVTITTVTRAYAEAERRGLVTAEVGRGTFVRETADDSPEAAAASPADKPDGIDMAFDRPPDTGPAIAAIASHIAAAAHAERDALLPSETPGGLSRHREAGAEWLSGQTGARTDPAHVVIAAGTQHAILLSLSAAAGAGDAVLCGALISYGMKVAAGVQGIRLFGVEMDDEGILPSALETAIHRRSPKALYLSPTHHTPNNATMSDGRRARVAAVCAAYNLTIIEEDCYAFLDPERQPIAALAPERTIYFGSLSKCVSSSLPVAFIRFPARNLERAHANLRATIHSTAPLMCEVAARMVVSGDAQRAVDAYRDLIRARGKIIRRMLPGADAALKADAHQLWLPLPKGRSPDRFVEIAGKAGVRLLSGRAFAPDGAPVPDAVRICFCAPNSEAEMKAGLEKLAEILAADTKAK
ncbi:MAG: GntR family transcriptional regulator [Alphaproteobacteria bacterium]|nr:GntR family transcriptional regulator [Alphaproteobacteria bacterium]